MKRTLIYVMLGVTLLLNSSFLTRTGQASKRSTLSFIHYNGSADIHLIDSTGENFQKLTTDDVKKGAVTWSPDGRFFAYHSNVGGSYDLYVMDVRKKESKQLTNHPGSDVTPAWAPNGKWIAYFLAILPKMIPGVGIEATKFWADNVICVINVKGENTGEPLKVTRKISSNPVWVPEAFFSVSPSAEKQSVLWGTLKASEINTQ